MADTLENVNCPACGKLMHKIFIKNRNIFLDVCIDGCGGILFNNREFQMFDEQHEDAKEVFDALKGKTFDVVDETELRVCPVCGANMVKNYSSIKKKIQVDDCYTCGAKFLDNNELNKIREEYTTDAERAADVEKHFLESTYTDELGVEHNVSDLLAENKLIGEIARADVTNADRLTEFISFIRSAL